MDSTVLLALGAGIIAVLWAIVLTVLVMRKAPGNARMIEIAGAIQEGASAYLNRQYIVIAGIGAAIAIVIYFALGWETAVLYVLGAVLSAAAGYVGMNVAVRATPRHAEGARRGPRGAGRRHPGDGGGRPERPQRRPQRRLPGRRRHRHDGGRPRPPRSRRRLPALPQPRPPGRPRLRRQPGVSLRPVGRRHLHQGGRRRRRPGRQGGGGHPRGRP